MKCSSNFKYIATWTCDKSRLFYLREETFNTFPSHLHPSTIVHNWWVVYLYIMQYFKCQMLCFRSLKHEIYVMQQVGWRGLSKSCFKRLPMHLQQSRFLVPWPFGRPLVWGLHCWAPRRNRWCFWARACAWRRSLHVGWDSWYLRCSANNMAPSSSSCRYACIRHT